MQLDDPDVAFDMANLARSIPASYRTTVVPCMNACTECIRTKVQPPRKPVMELPISDTGWSELGDYPSVDL